MKNIIKIFILSLIFISCSQEDLVNNPETNQPPKINIVKLIKDGDTTSYSFKYNADTTKLTSVLRDDILYANLSYTTNQVLITTSLNTAYIDSFLVILSPTNYIDSLTNVVPIVAFFGNGNPVSITRGVNSKLFESRSYLNDYFKREGNFPASKQQSNTFSSEYNSTNNNLISYSAEAIQNIFSFGYKDTVIYDLAKMNQPNLPDQFVTNMQSYVVFQGKPLLTPMFLLQQSNIYPYRTHTNLINYWRTSELNFIAPPPGEKINYIHRYSYSFDGRSRVTQMDVNLDGANYLTYQFVYFN